ncbi:MAG: AraC family transcriptional regulator, partial [Pseudomonadota bacterium]
MANKGSAEQARFSDRLREAKNLESTTVNGFVGRRLRASRLMLGTEGISPLDAAIDHTLIFHIGGGHARRFEGQRETGRTERHLSTTMMPAHVDVGWDVPEDVDILHLYLDDADLRRFAEEEFGVDPSAVELRDYMAVDDPFMQSFAPMVLQELQSDLPHSQLMLDGFDAIVAAHMLRGYSNIADIRSARPRVRPADQDRKAVRTVADLLRDRLAENLSIDELARTVGVSPFRLMRAFKADMGVSIHRFVIESRVARVHDLLLRSDDPLVEIAHRTGFANQSHMTSCYTALMGISPGRHRRQLRGRSGVRN